MARKLIVEIVGNSADFERSLARSGMATQGFGSKLKSLAKVAVLAGGALGIGAIAFGLDKSIKAAMAAETATARLNTAFKNSGLNAAAYAEQIDAAEVAGRKLGFTNEETKQSLGSLIVATKDTGKAISDLAVAQDLARFKSVDLETATRALTMAHAGSFRALKQLGITIVPVTDAVNALRAAHVGVKGPIDATALAAAKLHDKLATQASVIDIVTAKVHGQADAYSTTAAGAMARFSASVSDLEERIGAKLLPVLTSAVEWVNQHWPEISATVESATSAVSTAIGSTVDFVRSHWDQISAVFNDVKGVVVAAVSFMVDWIRSHWSQISSFAMQVFNGLKDIVSGAVAVVKAVWSQFGASILEIARRTWNSIGPVVRGAMNIIRGIVNVIAGLLHGDWSRVWEGMKQIVGGALSGMWAMLKASVGNALTAAKAVGSAILSGVAAGIKGLADRAARKFEDLWNWLDSTAADMARAAAGFIGSGIVGGILAGLGDVVATVANWIWGGIQGAIDWVKHKLGISSPSKVMADQVGLPMMQGLSVGIVQGTPGFQAALNKAINEVAIKSVPSPSSLGEWANRLWTAFSTSVDATKAQGAIIAKKLADGVSGALTTEFGKLATKALAAFDSAISAWKSPAQKILDKMQVDDQIKSLQDSINQGSQGITDANTALAKALAGGDPAEIATARQGVIDAQKTYDAAVRAQQEFQIGQLAAAQQAAHDAAVTKYSGQYQVDLANLITHLIKIHATHKQAADELGALYDKYMGPDGLIGGAGTKGALNIIQGMLDKIPALTEMSNQVGAAIKSGIPTDLNIHINIPDPASLAAQIEAVNKVLATLGPAANPPGGTGSKEIPQAALGGLVKAKPGGTLVNIGEAGYDEMIVPLKGPKTLMPLSSGGGYGGDQTINLVLDGEVIHKVIRKRDLNKTRQNGPG